MINWNHLRDRYKGMAVDMGRVEDMGMDMAQLVDSNMVGVDYTAHRLFDCCNNHFYRLTKMVQ